MKSSHNSRQGLNAPGKGNALEQPSSRPRKGSWVHGRKLKLNKERRESLGARMAQKKAAEQNVKTASIVPKDSTLFATNSREAKSGESAQKTMEEAKKAPQLVQSSELQFGKKMEGRAAGGRWAEASATEFKVRSKTYFKNKKKLPSLDTLFQLLHVDVFKVDGAKCIYHVAEKQNSWFQRHKKRLPRNSLTLIINMQVRSLKSHVVSYHVLRDGLDSISHPGLKELLSKMMTTSDKKWRDAHVKMIPRIVEAPYLVKFGVAQRPVIIGRKVKCEYFVTEKYLEIDCNVDSSSVSAAAVKLAHNWSTCVVCDLAWLLEAKTVAQLPERILATVRVDKIALTKASRMKSKSFCMSGTFREAEANTKMDKRGSAPPKLVHRSSVEVDPINEDSTAHKLDEAKANEWLGKVDHVKSKEKTGFFRETSDWKRIKSKVIEGDAIKGSSVRSLNAQ
mmetsp:Transcript_6703/g.10251  ORF Transcript_6703/g.10251 Transcript_6703/m.10251 type:complete len:450 (+) Transcript_6703:125-1474(+)